MKGSNKLCRILVTTISLFLTLGMAMAQNLNVTGKVVDVQGQSVVGASIVEKGTTNGTMSDPDGGFTLRVKEGASLEITFVGYKSKVLKAASSMRIVLEEDAEFLSDAVVVGFGTQKKENLTGAVSSVNVGKALDSRPIADVGRGLQGAAAGLNVRLTSSEVGAEPVLRIRGQFASINGGSSPLILLDNVEIPSIQIVNPDDIESISVLKDAASASIYGAKAAFGVILITSKKGAKEEGKVNVTYSGNLSFQNLAKPYEMAGVNGMHYTVQAFERTGGTVAGYPWYVSRNSWQAAIAWQEQFGGTVKPNGPMVYGRDYYYDGNRVYGVRTYDPQDYMVRKNAPTTSHNLSVAGKRGNTDYNMSIAYLDQQGMMKPAKHDDYSRWNANVRVNTKVNNWLSLHSGIMFTQTNKRWAYNTAVGNSDMWLYLYRWGPTIPNILKDSNGYSLRGPVFEASASNTASNKTHYTSVNAGTTITPLKNWDINFDYTYADQEYTSYRPGTRFYAGDTWSTPTVLTDENGNAKTVTNYWSDYNGMAKEIEDRAFIPGYYTSIGSGIDHVYQSSSSSQRQTINLTTTYSLDFADVHKLDFMLGAQSVSYKYTSNWSQKMALMDYENPQFSLATGTQTSGGDYSWNSTLGFFGRINYNLKERYLVEANLRYDGSSKFPDDLKWMWFPSVSAGWRVTEEPWMAPVKSVMNNLKVRASWGSIGDQSVASSMYLPTMSGSTSTWIHNGQKDTYYGTPAAVSSSLTWQEIETLDLGVDLSLFHSFDITFDWYRRKTNGMIVPGPGVSYTYGTSAPKGNYGSLQTDGWELTLNYGHVFDNGLSLTLNASIADALTEITKYGTTTSISDWYVGKHYGEIWGFKVDRLYQNSDFERDAKGNLIVVAANDASNPDGYKYAHYKYADASTPLQGRYNASSAVMFGPGDVKYKDLNGDGVIDKGKETVEDHGDLEIIGNTTPRYEYSFRIDAAWKGFDFSMFFQGIGKRDMWGSSSLTLAGYNSSDGSMAATFADDFWYEEFDDNGNVIDSNYDAFYPRAYNMGNGTNSFNMMVSDRYLLNMAYLRLKNVTLGYTIPQNLLKKANISNLRVYLSAENLFTFDHLNGIPVDPEVVAGYSSLLTSGYNQSRAGVGAPGFKSVSFGVQLSF